jgi:hypothetical protein
MQRLSVPSLFFFISLVALSFMTISCAQSSAQSADGGGGGRDCGGRGGRGGFGGGAQPVVVATVSQKDVPVDIDAVGNVEASATIAGIVEKNAIMQIDFALEAQRSGMRAEEAIYQGCLVRFRPIMMTTMAAMLGAVPIAIGYGAGGEARQPLGLVVVGGLLFSQLVTLYLTPVVFIYMAQLQQWLGHRSQRGTNPIGLSEAPAE